MVSGMKKRDLEKALIAGRATKVREKGDHEIWRCACGQHQAPLPRHRDINPGVVASIIKRMACHQEGWLT